ncbi:MAG TPA: hypothetical protein DCZ92_01735, partial [Elusimicrobia bacterium]|nr:hypothetical protein [Elusimicrobiota bacterium]
MKKAAALIFIIVALLAGKSALAGVFSQTQMGEIACAGVKMQLFYYYLDPNRDPKVTEHKTKCKGPQSDEVVYKMPPWLDTAVPEMAGRKVWRDPEEGEISEASVWQTPISILYEYLELTRKTFPQDLGGASIAPGLLVKEYADIRIRFQMSLDRLYRARTRDMVMGDSLGGRGRTIMPVFNLILKEMESIADAISSADSARYAEAVTASAVLSQDIYKVLFVSPRLYREPPKESSFRRVVSMALTIFGMFLMFLAVTQFMENSDPKNNKMMGNYARTVEKYSEAFGRQFIRVDVRYL